MKEFFFSNIPEVETKIDSPLCVPIFQCTKEESKDIFCCTYMPGLFDYNKTFYSFPLIIDHIQINYLKHTVVQKPKNSNLQLHNFEFEVIIYNNDFTKNRKELLSYQRPFTPGSDLLKLFLKIVNEYCKSSNDIFLIDFNKLYQFLMIKIYNPNIYPKITLIQTVNNLFFKRFKNSSSRPRCDYDYEWSEIELYNIPKNYYIKNLIANCLKKQFGNVKVENNYFLVEAGGDTCVSSFGRVEDTSDREEENGQIRNRLIIDIIESFNMMEYEFSLINVHSI